jgi:hypothetical protein
MNYVIKDWAGNLLFDGIKFSTFDAAESYLSDFFDLCDMSYDQWRDEYIIEETKE